MFRSPTAHPAHVIIRGRPARLPKLFCVVNLRCLIVSENLGNSEKSWMSMATGMGLDMYEIFQKSAVVEIVVCVVPLWVALMIGFLVGWSWRPFIITSKLTFALTALSLLKRLYTNHAWNGGHAKLNDDPHSSTPPHSNSPAEEGASLVGKEQAAVTHEDLENLCHLLDLKDGGPAWQVIMNRSTSTMTYKAWRYEPETGPTAYCSRTVIEDVTPELMRDFFWDDDFRPKWDNMLIYFKTLEECPLTGTMIVHWIRKFPFFCSDREYIIGRRIWECGRTYFCVTKGVPYASVPRQSKPRRVDLYHSSWRIRAVESIKGDGQLTASEVTLFHNEDMGIPKEIVKIGVRQGMWGTVKKIEPGVRAYQVARKSDAPLSRSAFMAQINSKVSLNKLGTSEISKDDPEEVVQSYSIPQQQIAWRWLIVGGAVVLACGLRRGVVNKALIFGVARRFGKLGKNS